MLKLSYDMKGIKLLIVILFALPVYSYAQQGNNQIQLSAQAAIPTGRLANFMKAGIGGAVKGMYGITWQPQALTIEGGYNRFDVKRLNVGASAHYSAIPIYAGYRANLDGIIIEAQGGVSFNRIAGSTPTLSTSSNQTAFGWALSAGYVFRSLEMDVKYQSSEASNDDFIIRFFGFRLAYNIKL